jgi:hypothetical protein
METEVEDIGEAGGMEIKRNIRGLILMVHLSPVSFFAYSFYIITN